jgi:hypothetical protein
MRVAFGLKLTRLLCELIALFFISRARGAISAFKIFVRGRKAG